MEEYMDWYRIDQMRIHKFWDNYDNYHPIEVYGYTLDDPQSWHWIYHIK